jgi:RNA polymerase sigma-70 factor (ECF subfamily)
MENNDTIYMKRFGWAEKIPRKFTYGEAMEKERVLVKRAKHGDVDAFAQLYEQIYQNLYRFALYTLRNPQDAEDVVSDAVMDAFAQIGQLKKEEAFSGWMYRILTNKCNRKLREYYGQRMQTDSSVLDLAKEEEAESAASVRPSCSEWTNRPEEYMDVRNAFFELENQERMILAMHLFLGYKSKEIADFLKMNENTVRSQESRALRKLEKKLKGI